MKCLFCKKSRICITNKDLNKHRKLCIKCINTSLKVKRHYLGNTHNINLNIKKNLLLNRYNVRYDKNKLQYFIKAPICIRNSKKSKTIHFITLRRLFICYQFNNLGVLTELMF